MNIVNGKPINIISALIGTGVERALVADSSTNALVLIDHPHHEIHSGKMFNAFHSASGKNDGDTINIYFKTPNTTTYCHCFMQWSSSGAAYGRIYEAPTVTSNTGTNAIVVVNSNRNSANASAAVDNATSPAANKYGIDVTVTAPGTTVNSSYSGSAKQFGGESRNENEYVLKSNTAYVFEVESDAAGLTLGMRIDWYEHTDAN